LGLFGPRREGIEGGVAFLRTAEMRDGKEGVCPVGPTHTLVGALVESRVPRIHADARPAAGDGLDLIVPPVPREVETFTNLGTEELVVHLGTARVSRGDPCLGRDLSGSLFRLFRTAEMRDVKSGIHPVGPAHPLMVAILKAELPDIHADAHPTTGDELDLIIPPVIREVVAQPHLRVKEVVAYLRAAL